MKKILIALVSWLACLFAHAVQPPSMQAIEDAARIAEVDWTVLYALLLRESQRQYPDKTVRPWPYTVGPRYFDDYESAVKELRRVVTSPQSRVDIGVGGINWYWNGHRYVDHPELLLDPDLCAIVAGRVLRDAMRQAGGDLRRALSIYNSGKPEGNLEYADYVLVVAKRIREQH